VVAEPARIGLRYRLLETIRLFAAKRLAEAAAHCTRFLAVAEQAAAHLTGLEQGKWLARLDADQANLRLAAGHAAGCSDGTALVLRLGVALNTYWWIRSRQPETYGLLVPALRRPDAGADPALFGAALVTARYSLISLTSPRHSSLLNRRSRSPVSWATSGYSAGPLGHSAARISSPASRKQGSGLGRKSLERARPLGDDVLLAWSLLMPLDAIDPARSGQLYTEAIACTERSGDHLINSILHGRAGVAALAAGDIPAARAHLDAAAQAAQQIGWESTNVPTVLGRVLREERDLDGARATFEDALRISRRTAWTSAWPAPSPAWPAWPEMAVTGTAQPHSTASRKPFRTGPAIRGKNPTR
jgi:hypothetical protein